jgi:hypothetical protein
LANRHKVQGNIKEEPPGEQLRSFLSDWWCLTSRKPRLAMTGSTSQEKAVASKEFLD